MRTRYFRQTSTGQWLAVVITSDGPFQTSAAVHLQSVEDAYHLPGDVTVVETDAPDPRTGTLLFPPEGPSGSAPGGDPVEAEAIHAAAVEDFRASTAAQTLGEVGDVTIGGLPQ